MSYRIINGKMQYIQELQPYSISNNVKKVNSHNGAVNFNEILQNEINKEPDFVISNHAKQRLLERNIEFNQNDLNKIREGIDKAEEKGCSEGVILYKDVALVASIKNRTVITAMNKDESQGNIFTNIDSLVIL
ncbi:MAG: TIGR02530 family flagellar biosynthesis protein [Clostridiaceae bacterium]